VQTPQRRLRRRVRYFSPEQARGEPLDRRSDVFSLGVVMWELLTGHRLFGAATAFESLGNVLHAPIVAPSARRRGVPAALDRIVLRALERDRRARYDGADALAADLEAFLGTQRMRADAVCYILYRLFGGADQPQGSPERGRDRAGGDDEQTVAVGRTWAMIDPLAASALTPSASAPVPQVVAAPPAPARPSRATGPVSAPAPRPPSRRLRLPWAMALGLVLAGVCTAYGALHARARPNPSPPAPPPPAVSALVVRTTPEPRAVPAPAPAPPVVVIAADPIARTRPPATASAPGPRRVIKRRGRR
jgi:serine/threonine-protein kinase